MCEWKVLARGRWKAASGQSMSEYLVLTGMTTAIAILVANTLGVTIRQVFQNVAQRILSVVTGYP
jgi:Flp pilus assembly pilin Flp